MEITRTTICYAHGRGMYKSLDLEIMWFHFHFDGLYNRIAASSCIYSYTKENSDFVFLWDLYTFFSLISFIYAAIIVKEMNEI